MKTKKQREHGSEATEVSETNHTPTPWKVLGRYANGEVKIGSMKPERGNEYCSYALIGTYTDAEFIVRAVNSHEALVDVVKKLSSMCPSNEGLGGHAPLQAFLHLGQLAREVLAKAEQGAKS